jgi:hypothetical protein
MAKTRDFYSSHIAQIGSAVNPASYTTGLFTRGKALERQTDYLSPSSDKVKE